MKKTLTLLNHPLLDLISRWILGGVFIYSSLCKIYMPMLFARAIQNYQLVPDTVARIMAISLPWLELICGILLIVGLFIPGSVRIIIGMLVLFIAALSINIIRGLDINCGCVINCFTGKEQVSSLQQTLFFDLIYLAMAIQILFSRRKWLSVDNMFRSSEN